MKESEKVEFIGLLWALSFQAKAFGELAAGFARIDKDAALRAVVAIEHNIAASLYAERDKLIQSGQNPAPLVPIASRLREMLLNTKQEIEQASKPH